MSSAIKPVFTATSQAKGGRNGHSEATDHSVAVNLSVPKEMGGPGKPGTTTPEHLFSAGYAACFGGALDFVGNQHKVNASGAEVTCAVTIGPRDGGGFGIAVKMKVVDKSIPPGPAGKHGGRDPRQNLPLFSRHPRQYSVGTDRCRQIAPSQPSRFREHCAPDTLQLCRSGTRY